MAARPSESAVPPIATENSRAWPLSQRANSGRKHVQQSSPLFDHIVGAGEMSPRYVMERFVRIGRSSAANSDRSLLAAAGSAARAGAFGIAALVMLGFGGRNAAALLMAKLAMNIGRLDHWFRGPRP